MHYRNHISTFASPEQTRSHSNNRHSSTRPPDCLRFVASTRPKLRSCLDLLRPSLHQRCSIENPKIEVQPHSQRRPRQSNQVIFGRNNPTNAAQLQRMANDLRRDSTKVANLAFRDRIITPKVRAGPGFKT